MTQRPSVMHIVLNLDPGGAERLVVDLCLRLRDRVSSSVCCLDRAGLWAADLARAGIPVTALGRAPGFHPTLALRVAEVARRQGAGVLHCHQYTPFVYGSLAALGVPGVRVVFTEHGRLAGAVPSVKRRWANAVLARVPRRIVAVSRELRDYMLTEGFPSGRVEVIHNGIDPGPEPQAQHRAEARAALGLDPAAFVVGSVARFDRVKRLDVLVDAFAAVHARIDRAHLLLVGGGPEQATLDHRIRARGLSASVTLPGARTDARALMPAIDVYANTSDSEGISLTILEAMAAALPVVATGVGGTPDILTEQTPVLVASGNPGAVAHGILTLAGNDAARQRLGRDARARVAIQFSFDRMADRYVDAYRG